MLHNVISFDGDDRAYSIRRCWSCPRAWAEPAFTTMAYRPVGHRGRWNGGLVREDDPHLRDGETVADHDAQGASPGIVWLIQRVVRTTPPGSPQKPADFPCDCHVQTYPGRHHVDVHFEGRAADVFLNSRKPEQLRAGRWLFQFFQYCIEHCRTYKIQGVIFAGWQWFSEQNHGMAFRRISDPHEDHVHIELNLDGADPRGGACR